MLPRLSRPLGFALAAGLVLLLLPDPARAQVVIKVNDTVNFRLGFQYQQWAEYLQDPISQGYQQSFFIRRVRLYAAGNIAKDVSFLFDVDQPTAGRSTSALTKDLSGTSPTFRVNDAYGEWKVFGNDQFIIDVGKMLVPITRNSLQSTSSHLALDGGTFTFLQGAGTQSDTGRDLGFQLKSYLADDHLEVRGGVFDGFRNAANTAGAGSRNSMRFAGRVVYNFLDPEAKGYVPVGTWLGKKRILAIGGGFDTQGGYTDYGGDFMIDLPIGPTDAAKGQNAVTAHFDYQHFDGGCGLNTAGTAHVTNCRIPTLFEQDEIFTDLGFYFVDLKLQPFVRFEWDGFKEDIDSFRNSRRYMGGFNYYVAQQNLKLTAAFERIVPNAKGAATWKQKNTNHFVLQVQFYYF
jgi:Phosphate-selective porin O and P